MIVTNLSGQSELLTDYTQVIRKRRVNGDNSLSFLLKKTERNIHSYDLVEEESVIEYDGVKYRIKGLVEQFKGNPIKSITAYHTFYDIIDDYRYSTLTTGLKSINELLSFIFNGTSWTFSVVDSFSAVEYENFGNDNCLSLFQKVLERFKAEFEIQGNNIVIKNKIGSLVDFQFRFGHNIKTFKKNIDTNNLSTYIKGYGQQNEDGTYIVEGEYTSPNSVIFGIKHAQPYSNDTITQYDTLINHLKDKIQDIPNMSLELEFVILQDAGYPSLTPGLGDTVPTIYEPLNVDLDLRILEIEDYPESKKSPKVALSSIPKSFAGTVMNYSKQLLDKIYDENSGRLRYNVYDESVKRATEALNNSLTELEYPQNMGIIARDPNDPNRFVVLRSAGLGVTTDGGVTFKNAITADGVTTELLTAGQIKTNNIQIIGNDDLFYWDGNKLIAIDPNDANKYVQLNSSGLYIAKGALTIERPDGYKLYNTGIPTFDFGVLGATPPFNEPGISQNGYWYYCSTSTKLSFQYYTFKHTSRYLKVIVALYAGNENYGSQVSIWEGTNMLAAKASYSTDPYSALASFGETLTIDLGVPDGSMKGIYVRLNSGSTGSGAYGRVISIWKEG